MSVKRLIGQVWADLRAKRLEKISRNAVAIQERLLKKMLAKAASTDFGSDHNFSSIRSIADFQRAVPVRNYEQGRKYFDRIAQGQANVCWPGKPLYLAKTSGTTSGAKYIPITSESIRHQIMGARDALLMYMHRTRRPDFLDGKMMFLSGSPKLETNEAGMNMGRLSGIVNHFVPAYLQANRIPTHKTNCIEEWERKVDLILDEAAGEDLRLISGIPPWVQMFFERLEERFGKRPLEQWPNLQLFVQGGVDFSPYEAVFDKYLGSKVDVLEVFPASEGFFAWQDVIGEKGLLLMPDYGIFFEFIPMEEYGKENPRRLTLAEVELNVQYALILSTNAGLWAYDIGDTVKFISRDPYRLLVTGRVKHFISAFGEHVIAEEVNRAMIAACEVSLAQVNEFTVAPQLSEKQGESYHEWLVEFHEEPKDLKDFGRLLDEEIRKQNLYYDDLRKGNMLRPAQVRRLQRNASRKYMDSIGKLGGQNKFPHLSNDRKIADKLLEFELK